MKTMWRWTPIFLESKLLLVKKTFHSMVEYGEITMFPWFSPGVPVVFARKIPAPQARSAYEQKNLAPHAQCEGLGGIDGKKALSLWSVIGIL